MNWLEKFFAQSEPDKDGRPDAGKTGPVPAVPSTPASAPSPAPNQPAEEDQPPPYVREAEAKITEIQAKINEVAGQFARGEVNRETFVKVFEHYQKKRMDIERMLEVAPTAWREAAAEGKTLFIRQAHFARPLGFAIYENATGMPLATLGQFDLDPALMVPMLSSYREATKEMFGGRVHSSQIEGGRWMCFVAGAFTTVIAIYSTEPATRQLKALEETHLFFEKANHPRLAASPIQTDGMVFPHEYYLR